jgi:DNA-binding transcriptional MocR family regulator
MTAINLEKNSPVPLYRQLGDAIIQKISTGEMPPETKLPPIRALAAELKLNNTTVVGAYKYLEQRRMAYSVRGSGTYVAKPIVVSAKAENLPEFKDYINLADTSTDPAFFPSSDMRRAFDSVISRDGASAFAYPDIQGFLPLREAVSDLLSPHIKATPENIQIISNINHGLEMLTDALICAGDAVILETPSSQGAAASFAARGAKIVEVPLNKNGLDIEKFTFLAKKHKPKIIFLSPTYQIPTGLCYTDKVKDTILEIAQDLNAYIIEVDAFSDFYYGVKPQAMKENDIYNRVIYIKSFDRVLTSGLAGYMVCSAEIINRLRDTGGVSGYIQRSLGYYFKNNDFAAHCAKLRGEYAKRYKRAVAAAETFLSPYASFTAAGGGLSLWVSPFKSADYIEEFLKHKVLVSPGRLYSPVVAKQDFRISFANAPEDDISKGIGIIASVLGVGEGSA